MTVQTFSTRDLPLGEQLAAWRGWFAPVYAVRHPADDAPGGFLAESTVWTLGAAGFARVTAPRLVASRTAENIRRDPVDHWILAIGLRARTDAVFRGDSRIIPPLAPFITSLADPTESRRDQDERLHLYLPRDRFDAIGAQLDAMRGLVVPGPLGQLLADYLVLLGRSVPDLTDAERARLPDAIAAMIGSCIAPASGSTQAPQQFELTRMERVRRVVRQRIGSPSLGPNTLCRELGLSRTELYRMMEGEGGVAHYIQRQRLLACHAALRNPADTRPIAAIAEANGFFDASSFSRSFRRNFGATPGEVRAAAQTGGAPPPVLPATIRAEQLSLRDCLHAF